MNLRVAAGCSILALFLVSAAGTGCVYERTVVENGDDNDNGETLNVNESNNDGANDEDNDNQDENDDNGDNDNGGEAALSFEPSVVEFSQLGVGLSDSQLVEIDNVGSEDVEIDDIYVREGTENFSLLSDSGDVDDLPTTLEPDDDPLFARVIFSPMTTDPVEGELAVISSALDDGEQILPLVGNDAGISCMDVTTGDTVDFGTSAVDDTTQRMVIVRNCSNDTALDISDIEVSDDGGGVFELDTASLPDGFDVDGQTIEAGEEMAFFVEYTPVDAGNDSGWLQIEAGGTAGSTDIELVGDGVQGNCPVAEAAGSVDGEPPSDVIEAGNQDVVELTSSGSHDPDGTDLTYQWAVVSGPTGSLASFEPDATDPNPEFEVDIVGNFTLELTVFNEDGIASCEPATVDIEATPPGDIHIQLVWSSQTVEEDYGGPDSGAGIGTDLDIHYARASDEWGDNQTVYWSSSSQDWGSDGDVMLDIDALYGDDPENINHTDPASGGVYNVGVHYYCDNGYGSSEATVRIYFDNILVSEEQRSLGGSDSFWHVGDVEWGVNPSFNVIDSYDSDIAALNNC